jgi:hypothetical protein
MTAIAERLAQAYPQTNKGVAANAYSLQEEVTEDSRQTLLMLFAAVAFVLLIACANVAALQLARGIERTKEVAIRLAIGAGRGRVIRQLLNENALLSLLGEFLGWLLAKDSDRNRPAHSARFAPHWASRNRTANESSKIFDLYLINSKNGAPWNRNRKVRPMRLPGSRTWRDQEQGKPLVAFAHRGATLRAAHS